MNVVHIVSNKVWGGGERYALDLCRRLVDDEHSVAAITRGKTAVDAPFAASGIPTAKLPLKGVLDIVSPLALAKVLNRMAEPIVVHVHNFKDARTAVRARKLMRQPGKVRIVCTRHLVRPAKTESSYTRLYSDLDAIIFVSETARAAFLSTKPEIDLDKIHVVHNAIAGLPDAAAIPAPFANDTLTLAFLGRINPEKGLEVILKALQQLPDVPVRLLVAGTGKGTDVMPLVRMTREGVLADRVEWLGHVDNPFEVIARADVGVLPSICVEACPLMPLEFMSAARPVIATNRGGQNEIITEGTDGLLVPPADPAALAKAIRRLADDRKFCMSLSKAALKTIKDRYEYNDFYWKVLKIYAP